MNKLKADYWLNHIKQWQSSNLKNTEYCKIHQLNIKSFGNWKTKLYRIYPDLKSSNTSNELLSVSIVDDTADNFSDSGIQIQIKNITISVANDFNEQTLYRVINSLSK